MIFFKRIINTMWKSWRSEVRSHKLDFFKLKNLATGVGYLASIIIFASLIFKDL